MHPPCQSFRDEFHDPRGPEGTHADECAECAAYAKRIERAAGALAQLERRAAPLALDGVVVAALEAGARQERATDALSALGRLAAPELVELLDVRGDLEQRAVESAPAPARLQAPQALARLVAEELLDPAAAQVRRYVASLPRLAAPEALAERLIAGAPPARGPRALAFLPGWRRGALAAAAVLALLLVLGPWRGAEEPRPRLKLVPARLADTESLDPFARSLIGGLAGGLAAVEETR